MTPTYAQATTAHPGTTDYAALWYWVREREEVRRNKEDLKLPHPWTIDPVLSAYRFCCVRREDDRGTRWIRENVRQPYADHPNLWLMLCISRVVNWPDTLTDLIDQGAWPVNDDFDPRSMTEVLNARCKSGRKTYTGAYMIPAPHDKGGDKQAYVAENMVGELWRRRRSLSLGTLANTPDMSYVHSWVMRTRGWGPFLSYQAVVDMRFTRVLSGALDVGTWAAAGPGTIRGLNRVHGRPVGASLDQRRALDEIRTIYQVAERETGVHMDLSDVPNILCETDKYLRVALDQGKPRARYVPGRGS